MSCRFGLLIALAFSYTGCSPYIYKTQTAGFSTGVDELKKAHEGPAIEG